MTQYNEYAQRLDTAFKEATEAHNNALTAYQTAETACKSERDPAKRQLREAELAKAKDDLTNTQRKAWARFRSTRDTIGRELERAVEQAHVADPDAIDDKAVALLNSGIMNSKDLAGMANKYADNPTMLRLIGNRAHALSDDARDPAERVALNRVHYTCANRKDPALERWNALKNATVHYSAENNRHADASLVSSLSDHWNDPNVRDAIDNF